MKPATVINRGEHFVTLRATTDRPAEIQEALAARDVLHVFKGDQNQAWDAVLANHCLARAVGDAGTEITCFVQDERLGTSDARLRRWWRQQGRRYVLTEDYYRGRSGAVWVHQDVASGLFFTEAVAPEQYARAGVHLHQAALLWERHAAAGMRDLPFLAALEELGVSLRPAAPDGRDGSSALAALAREDPAACLYHALTKTDGLYGLVPVEDDNVSLSSIPLSDPDVLAGGRALLRRAVRGALRLAAGAEHRAGVAARARRVAAWAESFRAARPGATIADLQEGFGQWLTGEIFPSDRLELDRTSRFMRLTPADLPRLLAAPETTLHFFLDLALRWPAEFTAAYNEALNTVGFGLQRIKYDPASGRYTPPFFVEYAPGGAGTPTHRYAIEILGADPVTITLSSPSAADVVVRAAGPVRSAAALAAALLAELDCPDGLTLVGKAAPFAAELQRSPRGLGLPRQGSKYAPLVDHLMGGLRARGVLDQPTGLLIRIGLNALDRLEAMGDVRLRLPRYLHGELGPEATCSAVARGWRAAAGRARALLELLSRCHFGQYPHLLRAICLNARGGDWNAALAGDARLARLEARLGPGDRALLRELGRDVPPAAVAEIERLSTRRAELLSARRALAAEAAASHRGGRLVPDPRRLAALEEDRSGVECRLLLLFAACVRRLWQRAESLPYANDRPYTLALYLLFGSEIFAPICRQVEFDVEYLSPRIAEGVSGPAREGMLCHPGAPSPRGAG